MNVCDDCATEEIEYCDQDDSLHYCSECFLLLDNEFVKEHRIKKIDEHIKSWSKQR